MLLALKVLLQLAVRDIGQLTDIESRRALADAASATGAMVLRVAGVEFEGSRSVTRSSAPPWSRRQPGAIEGGPHGYDADDPALVNALWSLALVCFMGGRAELWEPFHAALARLTPEPPPCSR